MHDSAWSTDLTVEVDGHGVVSHTGSAVLRLVADGTGLTDTRHDAHPPTQEPLPDRGTGATDTTSAPPAATTRTTDQQRR